MNPLFPQWLGRIGRIRPIRRMASGVGLLLWVWVVVAPVGRAGDTKGAVASVHPLATRAGLEAMAEGGNAVDGAIATALMLGVVDGHNSGLGGGCFLLIRLVDGRQVAIDGREQAPAGATREMFLRDGKADPRLSQSGALAAGVPGQFAALCHASTNYGRLPMSRLLEKAAKVAEKGFRPGPAYLGRTRSTLEEIAWAPADAPAFAGFRQLWGGLGGGRRLFRQPELAAFHRVLAREGVGGFYGGTFAARVEDAMKASGGVMTASDLGEYRPRLRVPLVTTYRGVEIVGFPPPSSGGVHVAEILNLLENFDLRGMGEGSADFVHVVAEAMKLAFADRAHWLGDPDFAKVPRGLLSKGYARELAGRIEAGRVVDVVRQGEPPGADTDVFEAERHRHTTHFSVADAEGNWVACTATVNTSFGSKLVVPGTGLVLNNQMDDFVAQPGVPNFFGLVGADANAVEARKRPLSSMSPTIVLREGRPVLAVGAAGGPTIISQTLLAIVRVVDFGKAPGAALAGPRFHHQWRPDILRLERGWGEPVAAELRRRGHRVDWIDGLGATQAVGRDGSGRFQAAADPRVSEGSGRTR